MRKTALDDRDAADLLRMSEIVRYLIDSDKGEEANAQLIKTVVENLRELRTLSRRLEASILKIVLTTIEEHPNG